MTRLTDDRIHDPAFVASLFDEMSSSYGITNYISSFGFCERWRRQTVEGIPLTSGLVVVDLMSGMGECWRFIQRRLGSHGRIIAIDLSVEMCRRALRNRAKFPQVDIEVLRGNALSTSLPDGSADCVVACFGLKTFSASQLELLAREVSRVLKAGGAFSLVEIATPPSTVLRVLYLFYLRYLIPILGRLFLGNPDNYRLLSVYTESFARGGHVTSVFAAAGLSVAREELFFGCAQRFIGIKPHGPALQVTRRVSGSP